MFMYLSKWYQGIIKTPRPDVEEAVVDVKNAIEELNRSIKHLESIEGVSGQLKFKGWVRDETIYFGHHRVNGFKCSLDYVSENHRREF